MLRDAETTSIAETKAVVIRFRPRRWSTSLGPCRLGSNQEPVEKRWRCRAAPRTPPRIPRRARQGSAQEEVPLRRGQAAPRTPPPGSQGPSTISPPSAIALKGSLMLSVGVTVHSATGDTVTGPFLSTFSAVSNTTRPRRSRSNHAH